MSNAKFNTAVTYFTNGKDNNDQNITLLDSDEENISSQMINSKLQCHTNEDDYNLTIHSSRPAPKKRNCSAKVCPILSAILLVLVVVLIWIAVGSQYKSTRIGVESISYAELQHSSMRLTFYNTDGESYFAINLGKDFTKPLKFGGSKSCIFPGYNEALDLCLDWGDIKLQITSNVTNSRGNKLQYFLINWETTEATAPQDCIYMDRDAKDNPVSNHLWLDTRRYKLWPLDVYKSLTTYDNVDHLNKINDNCGKFTVDYSPGSEYSKTAIPIQKMGGNIVEPLWIYTAGGLIKAGMDDPISAYTTLCPPSKIGSEICIGTSKLSRTHLDYHNDTDIKSKLKYVVLIGDDVDDLYYLYLTDLAAPNKEIDHHVKLNEVRNNEVMYDDGVQSEVKPKWDNEYVPFRCLEKFDLPIWNIFIQGSQYDENTVKEEIKSISGIGGTAFLNFLSEISTQIGDYDVRNDTIFMGSLISTMHALNFSVMLPVTPFIEHRSVNFEYGKNNNYFVKSDDGDGGIVMPTVTQGEKSHQVALVDFTNPDAKDWYINNIKNFKKKSKADYLYFSHGQASWLPSHFKTSQHLHNPAYYSTLYTNVATHVTNCSVSDVAYSSQLNRLPVMLSRRSDLHTTMQEALSSSLSGYPFFIPNLPSDLAEAVQHMEAGPFEVGFIRWIQLVTFFPIMHIPWDYSALKTIKVDIDNLANMVKQYSKIRNGSIFKHLLRQAIEDAKRFNKPVIRPIWMAPAVPPKTNGSSEFSRIFSINDQFMVGDDFMVAPVLNLIDKSRDIYFPPGEWVDISLNKGTINSEAGFGLWKKNYPAEYKNVPAFVRVGSMKEDQRQN